jgi:hypothetical protein
MNKHLCVLLLLPLGEGWDDGHLFSPHPNPLPEGEGTEGLP